MRWQWAVLIGTAACWGVLSGWALLDPVFAPARTVSLISTVSLAMAFAQVFSMAPRLSLLCTGMVYLPMLGVVMWVQGDIGLAVTLSLIALYLAAVIARSHREYEDKLGLEKTLREERDRFQRQSHRDALTGLANRRQFGETLDVWMNEARSASMPLSLLIIDIDWFKTINDGHGHAVGDACLSAFATRLQHHFATPQDVVARLGGEEFAVLIRHGTATAAMQRAEAFRAELASQPLSVAGLAVKLTVSIGVGSFDPRRHSDGDALYRDVDAALYQAKASGRNVVRAASAL